MDDFPSIRVIFKKDFIPLKKWTFHKKSILFLLLMTRVK